MGVRACVFRQAPSGIDWASAAAACQDMGLLEHDFSSTPRFTDVYALSVEDTAAVFARCASVLKRASGVVEAALAAEPNERIKLHLKRVLVRVCACVAARA